MRGVGGATCEREKEQQDSGELGSSCLLRREGRAGEDLVMCCPIYN